MSWRSFFVAKPWFIYSIAGLAVVLVFQNCGSPRYEMKEALTSGADQLGTPSTSGPSDTICDPGAAKATATGGLVAELYYMSKHGSKNATTVENFFNPTLADRSEKKIYFSQVNTLPQKFDKGFVSQSGEFVTNDKGEKLYEWFALKYFSEIKISRVEDEGFYELATLSDDGVVVEAQVDGKWQGVINDDGLHSPRWGCSSRTIEFKKDQAIPIRVYYYQGPAYQIANMLHWRKLASGNKPLGDKECGKQGSNYFFDPDTSTSLAPYRALLSRHWKVVPPEVFFLPNHVVNPCIPK
jgi:hypothetical protein